MSVINLLILTIICIIGIVLLLIYLDLRFNNKNINKLSTRTKILFYLGLIFVIILSMMMSGIMLLNTFNINTVVRSSIINDTNIKQIICSLLYSISYIIIFIIISILNIKFINIKNKNIYLMNGLIIPLTSIYYLISLI